MLKCAKNYGTEFDTLNPSREIQGKIPLWHHFGEDPAKIQINNSRACICLRENHGVLYTEQGVSVLSRLRDETHKQSATCSCARCKEDKRSRGCSNPSACIKAAEGKLSRLLPKWNPN
ncbi:hypothetical protein DFH06DRAFT_906931, partial [Mycena polygramma]